MKKKLAKTFVCFKGCKCEMEIPPCGLSSDIRCEEHNNPQMVSTVYSRIN